MNGGISRNTPRLFSNTETPARRLRERQDTRAQFTSGSDETETIPLCRYAEIIREEAPTLRDGVAFQSIAVASLQTLKKVLTYQRQAAEAAISLAQGEKLTRMIDDSEATAEAIVGILNNQGSHILNLVADDSLRSAGDNSWWFALAEVLHTIEDGTTRLVSLASGQPKAGPARRLSSIVVRLLRTHHHALMSEAEEWIS